MSKGMSQVLALIVAAAVFMMAGLTLVFMLDSGIGGAFTGAQKESCIKTIDQRCRAQGFTGSVEPPASCQKAGYPDYNGESTDTTSGVSCG